MMMDRAVLLVFCCLVMSVSVAPLYPSIRFGQRDTSILMTSIEHPMQLLKENSTPLTQKAELRSGRHADAIFTNSYRKVLGQISARKFLQSIMGKRLQEEGRSYNVKCQSDIYEGTYKQDLTSVQRKQSYRGQQNNFKMPRLCRECKRGQSEDKKCLSPTLMT
ncbi:somatoliberin [Oncorhynchus mykiss]|uniref:somatoliberin n=1 Tax=Oncorhynchus mykiss TaxID=8022 RepID=UPI001877A8F6|nr:somatoliberin [Oncorhynchus mykiss]XP_021465094.2 somatoliberin [Oncorhynchus mykiss]